MTSAKGTVLGAVKKFFEAKLHEPVRLDHNGQIHPTDRAVIINDLILRVRANGYRVRFGWSIDVELTPDLGVLRVTALSPGGIRHDLLEAFERCRS